MYNMFEIFVLVRGDYAMSSLASRIKELRKSHNLSQEQLGKIIGVAKSTISSYESGNSAPADEIKALMCRYFNVSMDYLMGMPADIVIGTELKQIITGIALELNEPYEKLVDIFLNKQIPKDITRDSLMSFFCIALNKEIKAARNGLPLSQEQKDLLSATSDLSSDDMKKALEYVEVLKLKRNS